MRDKVRALYYPDFWIDYPTLIKSILLFDEIHFMDRPSHTFDGQSLTIGMASPIRQHEKWFRDQGVPLYVHEPPSGPVVGELREVAESDLSDLNFMLRFQEGLRTSPHFRDLHIQPGNYGNNETHETILHRLVGIDLRQSPPLLDVHKNQNIRPYDFANPEGSLKTLVSLAAFCSVKMNFALTVGVNEGFSPLADMAPYANLLSAKYSRAVASAPVVGGKGITATDLSLAILDELVPPQLLRTIKVDDAIKYRKESEPARDAFLEHLLALQAKLGQVPADGDYPTTIKKIIATEVRPAAREFRDKLDTIYEKLVGKIKGAAVLAASSPAVVQIFGDVTLEKLLLFVALPAAGYVAKEGIEAMAETRAASRDCALSYLLDLEG